MKQTVLTKHNLSPKQTPKADPGSALSLLWVFLFKFASVLGLLGICYRFTWSQLLWSTYALMCEADLSFFLPPVSQPLVYSISIEKIFGHFSVTI